MNGGFVKLKLNNRGRKLMRGKGRKKFRVKVRIAGNGSGSGGSAVVKRVGRVR